MDRQFNKFISHNEAMSFICGNINVIYVCHLSFSGTMYINLYLINSLHAGNFSRVCCHLLTFFQN